MGVDDRRLGLGAAGRRLLAFAGRVEVGEESAAQADADRTRDQAARAASGPTTPAAAINKAPMIIKTPITNTR